MHISAILGYARASGLAGTRINDGFGAIWDILRRRRVSGPVFFMQSSGFSNLFVLPLARALIGRVVYYFHEPLPLNQKIKNDGFFKGLVMYCLQRNDTFWASDVLVSGEHAQKMAQAAFAINEKKIRIAPLLLPPPERTDDNDRTAVRRVTYLGRIDQRRYLREFVALADRLCTAGFVPTVLTGQPKALRRMVSDIPDNIEVVAVERFSEARKAKILNETAILWNPKSVPIAQSGVTAEAVKFGCRVVLTPFDPQYHVLREQGMVIELDEVLRTEHLSLDHQATETPIAELFNHMHGDGAFSSAYKALLR